MATNLVTITQATANAAVLASTGYSLTGSDATSLIDLAGTWNTSGTPSALKLNITNTASNASSKLIDALERGKIAEARQLEKTRQILGMQALPGSPLKGRPARGRRLIS